MDTAISGAAFGASLVASFMYQPHLLAAQFTLQHWNMVQTFLTATGSSALAIELLRQLNYSIPEPRGWSSTGLSSSAIDGNVLGGLLLGTGMALSLSCPGMALPQLALSIPSAPAIIAGSCGGGIVWSAILRPWIAKRQQQQHRRHRASSPSLSIPKALGMERTAALLLFEVALASAVAAVRSRTATAWAPLDPVAGGALVGGAQLVSLLLRGSLLGVSSSYEQLGDWVVYVARGSRRRDARPGASALLFSLAMVGGAWAVRMRMPELAPVMKGGENGAVRALGGGFLMAVGSRLAGGCASGHGISGLALMSLSSLVTMIATFAAAIGMSTYVL